MFLLLNCNPRKASRPRLSWSRPFQIAQRPLLWCVIQPLSLSFSHAYLNAPDPVPVGYDLSRAVLGFWFLQGTCSERSPSDRAEEFIPGNPPSALRSQSRTFLTSGSSSIPLSSTESLFGAGTYAWVSALEFFKILPSPCDTNQFNCKETTSCWD